VESGEGSLRIILTGSGGKERVVKSNDTIVGINWKGNARY